MAPVVRLGYVAHCLSLELTAGHTCRLANATPARLEELTAWNLAELEQILLFNEAHGIELFRIGSSLVPFASHPVNTTRWWKVFRSEFEALGRIASRSHQRLSLHPPPAGVSIASVRPQVLEAARRELEYSATVLDLLGQGPEARAVIHVGGAAPDRATAFDTAHRFLDSLPDALRGRITLEHDDHIWSAREVLKLAQAHGLPFLADTLHNAVLPSTPVLDTRALLRASAQTWHALGLRPKYHVAKQREGARPGAHADRIPAWEMRQILRQMESPADLMLEVKDKDLCLLELQEALGLGRRVSEPEEAWAQPSSDPLGVA